MLDDDATGEATSAPEQTGTDVVVAAPDEPTAVVPVLADDQVVQAGASVDHLDEPVDDVATEAARKKAHFARSFREWALVVIIAIGAAVLMKLFVVQQFYVSGQSMITTLHDYDRVLVNKLSYKLHDPNRGDVVVLEEAQGLSERDLIKRVIALPGETIEMRDCVVYIDGRVLVEPYLDPEVVTPNNCGPQIEPITIADDHVFVMGDNRPGSGDSRGSLGPVDYDQIVGRAFVVIWPKSDWQWL